MYESTNTGVLVPEPVGRLCHDLARRLRAGETCTAEEYLGTHPDLASSTDAAVELIYTEFVVRQELGQDPSATEFAERFPALREPLQQVFQIHAAMVEHDRKDLSTPRLGPDRELAPFLNTEGTPFEIIEMIGRGGMGVVYKARQRSLDRLVAVKMISAGRHASAEERRRFRREAEAIARLQHPRIVQIYDVGEHEGRPYLVLEYLPGGSLADQLKGKPQPAVAAARLVADLAEGMEFAHQRGIIHRDLKPANVLLSGTWDDASTDQSDSFLALHAAEATPKITDFGLARCIEMSMAMGDADDPRTRSGVCLGTPAYMAPEQAGSAPEDVGAAADIYALGAILYEMLTGRPPFLGESPLHTMMLLRTEEAVPVRRLQPRVPVDLETICLKCLQKEPARRYPTAGALQADLNRFLKGTPIQARPTSLRTRTWRWCRRQPVTAGLIAALVLVILGANVGLTALYLRAETEHRRAETNFEQAREAVHQYLFKVAEDERLLKADLVWLRRDLLKAAEPFYDRLLKDKPGDSRLDAGRAIVLFKRAEMYYNLGDYNLQIADLKQALPLFEALARRHPETPEYEVYVARTWSTISNGLDGFRKWTEAEEARERAVVIMHDLLKRHPDQHPIREELALIWQNRALAFVKQRQWDDCERCLRQTIAVRSEIPRERFDGRHRSFEAICQRLLGTVAQERGQKAEALTLYNATEKTIRADLQEFPRNDALLQELAYVAHCQGTVLKSMGLISDALARYQESAHLMDQLAADFPSRHINRFNQAVAHTRLYDTLESQGQQIEALAPLQRSITIREQMLAEWPDRPDRERVRHELARNYMSAMRTAYELGQMEEAVEHCHRALAYRRLLVDEHPEDLTYRKNELQTLRNLRDLSRLQKRQEDAVATQRCIIALADQLLQVSTDNRELARDLAEHWYFFAEQCQGIKRHGEAFGAYDEAQRRFLDLLSEDPEDRRISPRLTNIGIGRARALHLLGRYQDAVDAWRDPIAKAGPSKDAFRLERLQPLVGAGMLDQLGREVLDLAKGTNRTAADFYELAVICARAAEFESAGDNDWPCLTIGLLQRARQIGYFHNKERIDPLIAGDDFVALWHLGMFQEFVGSLSE